MTHLIRQSYGKHHVRVSKIQRKPGPDSQTTIHDFIEASIDVELEGDFNAAFVEGNNQLVIATDTCRNTIYVLAKDNPIESIESFGLVIATHFLKKYSHVQKITVSLRQRVWNRLYDSAHGFESNQTDVPTAVIIGEHCDGELHTSVLSGWVDCSIAKTTASSFADFHRDEFRTLPDSHDRILATSLSATWDYELSDWSVDFNAIRAAVRGRLLGTFLDHHSRSVQATLYRMAAAALESCEALHSITLTMPNRHHIRFDLQPFGRSNDNDVFVVTDEPFGYITATIARTIEG